MNNIEFHIDEPVMHDASIENKMDFDSLIGELEVSQNTFKVGNLSAIWVASTISCLFFGAFIALGFNTDRMKSESKMANNSSAPSYSSHDDDNISVLALVDVPQDIDESADPTPVDSEENLESNSKRTKKVLLRTMKKVELVTRPKTSDKKSISLEDAKMPKPIKIETQKGQLVVPEQTHPSGLPISVDFKTYADLKRSDYYYFEIDKPDGTTEILNTDDWESGDLSFSNERNRFRLELKKGEIKKVLTVKLVTGNFKLNQTKSKSELLSSLFKSKQH